MSLRLVCCRTGQSLVGLIHQDEKHLAKINKEFRWQLATYLRFYTSVPFVLFIIMIQNSLQQHKITLTREFPVLTESVYAKHIILPIKNKKNIAIHTYS